MDKNGDGEINLNEYMEEIRRAAGAFYEHLPAKAKKLAGKTFKAMDKNRDGQISLREYMKD
uniref:EF-hand domain-containing protein n=1 Tax=Salix viminalis TaxID=40686 RepID=A0A6N2KGH3_SALVM